MLHCVTYLVCWLLIMLRNETQQDLIQINKDLTI